jgi:hypothetical protein
MIGAHDRVAIDRPDRRITLDRQVDPPLPARQIGDALGWRLQLAPRHFDVVGWRVDAEHFERRLVLRREDVRGPAFGSVLHEVEARGGGFDRQEVADIRLDGQFDRGRRGIARRDLDLPLGGHAGPERVDRHAHRAGRGRRDRAIGIDDPQPQRDRLDRNLDRAGAAVLDRERRLGIGAKPDDSKILHRLFGDDGAGARRLLREQPCGGRRCED